MEPKNHKPIISTTLKSQHTEKDFGFADAALSLINFVSHSTLGSVLGWVASFVWSAGLSGKPTTALPHQSLNGA